MNENSAQKLKAKASTTILIVDDNASFLSVCKRTLSARNNFDILTAINASEALSIARKENPELILVDIDLGKNEVNGIKCVAELRAHGYQGTVCMMTANHSFEQVLDAAVAGADDYWVKSGSDILQWEIKNLFFQQSHSESQFSVTFQPIRDGAYLRSRGLTPEQIETLFELLENGFPSEKEAAIRFGIKPGTLVTRLSRIKKKLGLENIPQVSQLMTILSVYSRRRNKNWR